MPKALHDALKRTAKKKGYKGERADRYVYGTLSKYEKAKKGKGKKAPPKIESDAHQRGARRVRARKKRKQAANKSRD